jgi:hypothetical protein
MVGIFERRAERLLSVGKIAGMNGGLHQLPEQLRHYASKTLC